MVLPALIAGGLPLLGGVAGAIISSSAADRAAEEQARASREAAQIQAESLREASAAELEGLQRALDFQRELFDIGREDLAPFREAGQAAIAQLAGLSLPGGAFSEQLAQPFQFGAQEFEQDPGRQFRLEEGERALNRAASARGTLVSGGQLRDLAEFNQGLASQEFGAAHNRALQEFVLDREGTLSRANLLAQIAGLSQVPTGVQAGAQFGAAGGNALSTMAGITGGTIRGQAGALANDIITRGNIGAAEQVAKANAINQGLAQVGQTPLNFLLLQQAGLLGGGTGPTPTSARNTEVLLN